MAQQPRSADAASERQRSRNDRPSRRDVVEKEDVYLRNYDHRVGYDLSLEVIDAEGAVVFERRYYLQPLATESEVGVLPEGEYVIRATMDNLEREERRCRIDADPANTAVIEMGNGVLSLTHGLSE